MEGRRQELWSASSREGTKVSLLTSNWEGTMVSKMGASFPLFPTTSIATLPKSINNSNQLLKSYDQCLSHPSYIQTLYYPSNSPGASQTPPPPPPHLFPDIAINNQPRTPRRMQGDVNATIPPSTRQPRAEGLQKLRIPSPIVLLNGLLYIEQVLYGMML